MPQTSEPRSEQLNILYKYYTIALEMAKYELIEQPDYMLLMARHGVEQIGGNVSPDRARLFIFADRQHFTEQPGVSGFINVVRRTDEPLLVEGYPVSRPALTNLGFATYGSESSWEDPMTYLARYKLTAEFVRLVRNHNLAKEQRSQMHPVLRLGATVLAVLDFRRIEARYNRAIRAFVQSRNDLDARREVAFASSIERQLEQADGRIFAVIGEGHIDSPHLTHLYESIPHVILAVARVEPATPESSWKYMESFDDPEQISLLQLLIENHEDSTERLA